MDIILFADDLLILGTPGDLEFGLFIIMVALLADNFCQNSFKSEAVHTCI